MANLSKQKGDRFERQCVLDLKLHGFECARVPLSGAAGGEHHSDIDATINGRRVKFECKTRKRAWSDLFGWLKPGVHALLIKADRTDTLVVMTLDRFASLLRTGTTS